MTKIDLIKTAFLKIGDVIGEHNSIPIGYFVKISTNLQNLLITIAQFDIPSEEIISSENFSLELSGFRKSSAIPQFIFTPYTDNILLCVCPLGACI